MSQNQAAQVQDPHPQTKPANRWNNISSDEDQSESEHSERQQRAAEPAEQTQPVIEPADIKENKEEPKKKEANIVPFDAKKKFRGGDFAHLKTVKGGFKAEKLEKKKFHLDTVKNPFAFAQESDSESDNENKQEQQQEKPAEEKPAEEVETSKQPKKSKKQQEKEELEALLKELNAGKEPAKEQGEKKKKKKKAKKEEEKKEDVKQEQKVEQQPKAVEEFTVNKQTLEEVMRKKAESAKTAAKKPGKAAIANAARKAIEEREAKNKSKKVYVDL